MASRSSTSLRRISSSVLASLLTRASTNASISLAVVKANEEDIMIRISTDSAYCVFRTLLEELKVITFCLFRFKDAIFSVVGIFVLSGCFFRVLLPSGDIGVDSIRMLCELDSEFIT